MASHHSKFALAALLALLPVRAASRDAFLIRFGVDGVAADWSGSIAPAPARLAGWQFGAGDQVSASAWKCATRQENYWDTPYERSMQGTKRLDKVTAKGIVVAYDNAPRVEVTTSQGRFQFDPAEVRVGAPRRFLDGRVEVSRVAATESLAPGAEAEDYPSLLETKDGTLWMAYQSYENGDDQIYVRRGVTSKPEAIAKPGGDYFRTALAEDRGGKVWVVWSAQAGGNWDLYARAFDGSRWLAEQRLTSSPGADIYHALVTDRAGNLYLAWQSARSDQFDIWLRRHDGRQWSQEVQVSSDPANDWEPALAVSPDGGVTVLWDTYAGGNYDVVARTWRNGALGSMMPIAASGAFEARPSAQYDRQGRLWIAFEEGDWNWGKDYGQEIVENGRGLLVRRQARVAVLAGGKLLEPSHSIQEALPAEFRQAFVQPKMMLDAGANPWVLFRYRVNLPQGGRGRAMWRLGATTLHNGRWLPMIEFPEGFGRIDSPAAAAVTRDGKVHIAWPSDGRGWPPAAPGTHDLHHGVLQSGPAGTAPPLSPFAPSAENLPVSHRNESDDVRRVRAYRTRAGEKELRIVRGDIHRHTDVSWDGNRDGSLDDAYRYALDAASMDYLGVCDHQAGDMIPYNWWRIQKAADLFTIPGRFLGLYSYERSLPWPNGHRNVLFAERGRPVLAIADAEQKGVEGAAKLYAYLRQFGGLTSSHTSATGAGTDFRDSDAAVEPVVEIYQGYRRNYEGPQTPRAPDPRQEARFAAGFIWNAWAKGIKLGVQASSDHVSTHISYAAFYVDRMDRQAILDAARARRSYAATDNLIVDLRAGDQFMGSVFRAPKPPPLTARVIGTGPLARVHLIKNNRIIHTVAPSGSEVSFTFTDTDAAPGESYYYLRAEQQDGQLAWGSPIWVTVP